MKGFMKVTDGFIGPRHKSRDVQAYAETSEIESTGQILVTLERPGTGHTLTLSMSAAEAATLGLELTRLSVNRALFMDWKVRRGTREAA